METSAPVGARFTKAGQMARLRNLLNADSTKKGTVRLKMQQADTACTYPTQYGWDVVVPSSFDITKEENADIVLGMVIHEDGHHLYTDLDYYKRCKKLNNGLLVKKVLNAFDDIQQEHRKRAHRPGDHRLLSSMYSALVDVGFYSVVEDGLGCALFTVFFGGHAVTNDYPAMRKIAAQQSKRLRDIAGPQMADEIERFIPMTTSVKSTKDAFELALRFLDFFGIDTSPIVPPSTPPNSNDDSSDESDSGQAGDGSDSGDDDSSDESDSGQAGDGSDSGDDDSSDESDSGQAGDGADSGDDDSSDESDSGQAGDGADSGDDDSSDESDSGQAGSSDAPSGSNPAGNDYLSEVQDEVNSGAGESVPSADALDTINSNIKDCLSPEGESAIQFPSSNASAMKLNPPDVGDLDVAQAKRLSSGLASHLRKLLVSQSRTQRCYRENGKRTSVNRLINVWQGETRVYRHKKHEEGSNTAVSILVDLSPSMEYQLPSGVSRITVANQVGFALANAIEMINGNVVEIFYFDEGGKLVKPFNQRIAQIPQCIGRRPDGFSTNISSALEPALLSLLRQPQPRKVLLALTDGHTESPDKARALIRGAEFFGIDSYGIAIGDASASQYVTQYIKPENTVTVSTEDELRNSMFELVSNAMISPPRG